MMNKTTRQTVYAILTVINAILVAATQQDLVPAKYAVFVTGASYVVAMLMKEWNATDQKQLDPPAGGDK